MKNPSIEVRRVDDENLNVFIQLSQAYEREFSPITKKVPDEHGLYSITEQKSGKYDAWLAYQNDQVVGFAVIDISEKIYDVAEFYVRPEYRQSSIGRSLAFEMFARYPGSWRVRQIIGAEYARAFWISVIRQYTGNSFIQTIEDDVDWGKVYTQRFSSQKLETDP